MNIKKVLKQREEVHGDYVAHSLLSQKLKDSVRLHEGFASLSYNQKESIDMILHKISRVVNSRVDEIDNWVDICGYAQLIVNYLNHKRCK